MPPSEASLETALHRVINKGRPTLWRSSQQRMHGRGEGGKGKDPGFGNLTFSYWILVKKGCFLSFEWVKWNFTNFAPFWKNLFGYPWKNPLFTPPLEKILPTFMSASHTHLCHLRTNVPPDAGDSCHLAVLYVRQRIPACDRLAGPFRGPLAVGVAPHYNRPLAVTEPVPWFATEQPLR